MAVFTSHNSWGRTRSPKNLAGTQGGKVTLSIAADLLGITATTTGHATENQRYLHVLTEDNNAAVPGTISVYGYCHAFLRWFELPESDPEGLGDNAQPVHAVVIVPADSGHADAADITPVSKTPPTLHVTFSV